MVALVTYNTTIPGKHKIQKDPMGTKPTKAKNTSDHRQGKQGLDRVTDYRFDKVKKSLRVICPPASIVKAFDAVVDPLVAAALNTANQSRTLSALRDALLPKLMSGSIRLRDVEQIVGRAT
jgi:hypothetical protein